MVYRERLGLSPATVAAVFGVYALGLIPAFLLGGPLSDRWGRRRVVLPATVGCGLASLLFLPAAHSVGLLFLARFVQGLVSGAVFTVGSAWLAELAPPGAAGRRAAVSMSAGFSAGALGAGLLGEYAPAPTAIPYLLHAALVAAAVAAIARLPETVAVRPRNTGARIPLTLPGTRRLLLTVVVPVAVCVYAFPSVVIAALPLLVRLPGDGVLATGALAGLTLAAAALAAPLQHRWGERAPMIGAVAGAAGYAVAAAAAGGQQPGLLVPAAVLLGMGSGLCLSAGLDLVATIAIPQRRGALSGIFFACAYLGFAAPFLVTGLAGRSGPVLPLLLATALCLVLAGRLLRAELPATPVPVRDGGR